MAETHRGEWVERMFPEPVDLGIADPDRAVTNVSSGTDTTPEGPEGSRWYAGGGRRGCERIARSSRTRRRGAW